MNELPCIICGRELEPAIDIEGSTSNPTNQPYLGTVFTTGGHYGSTVFDPMTPTEFLEITVCDPCLLGRKERVLYGHRVPPPEHQYETWEPEDSVVEHTRKMAEKEG